MPEEVDDVIQDVLSSIANTYVIATGLEVPIEHFEDYVLGCYGIKSTIRFAPGAISKRARRAPDLREIMELAILKALAFRVVFHLGLIPSEDRFSCPIANQNFLQIGASLSGAIEGLRCALLADGVRVEDYAKIKSLETGVFSSYRKT